MDDAREPRMIAAADLASLASRSPKAAEAIANIGQAADVAAERRAMVLRHEDIAKRLVTELGYQRPGQWNGYIPPSHFDGSWNDSPRRQILLEIEADAWQADQGTSDHESGQ